MRRRMVLLALVLLSIAAPAADAQGGITLRIDAVDARQAPQIDLLVSLLDSNGRPIGGEDSAQFLLREGDRSRAVGSVGVPANLSVVLAIDMSCALTMGLERVKAAAITLLEGLAPGDQAALLLIGYDPWLASGFSTDHRLIIDQVAALHAGQLADGVALYNGIAAGVRVAAEQPVGRRALVLLTNGHNRPPADATSLSLGEVQLLAATRQVPIYTVSFGEDAALADLQALAADGQTIVAERPTGLDAALREVGAELRPRYKVRFTLDMTRAAPPDLVVAVARYGTASAPIPIEVAPPLPPTALPPPTAVQPATLTPAPASPTPLALSPAVEPAGAPPAAWPLAGLGAAVVLGLLLCAVPIGILAGSTAILPIWYRERE